MYKIKVPVSEECNHMFQPSDTRRPFQRLAGDNDFVTYSKAYSKMCGEPVWFYSWGNSRWLRCPMGCPGDRLNTAGDRIAAVDVILVRQKWMFVYTITQRTP